MCLITNFHTDRCLTKGIINAFETILSPEIPVNQLLCIITQRVNLFNVRSKVAIKINTAIKLRVK